MERAQTAEEGISSESLMAQFWLRKRYDELKKG